MKRRAIAAVLLAVSATVPAAAASRNKKAEATSPAAQITENALAMARQALFVRSDIAATRTHAAAALKKDPRSVDALFIEMEAAALAGDTSAALDAAVRICEATNVADARARIAAARVRELAANSPEFLAVVPRLQALIAANSVHAGLLRLALLDAAVDGWRERPVEAWAHAAGMATDWRITGPFGRTSNLAFDRTWLPEEDGMSRDAYDARPVTARHHADGVVRVGDAPGVYYAAGEITLASSGAWNVTLESAGTAEVFVDASSVLRKDDRLKASAGVASRTVRLGAGRHAILVKALPSASPFRIHVMPAIDPPAREIALRFAPEAAYVAAAAKFRGADFPQSLRLLATARRQFPSASMEYLAAQAWAAAAPGAPEEELALRNALEHSPEALAAELDLAQLAWSEHRTQEALEGLRRVLAKRPEHADAQALMAAIAVRMDWQAEAQTAIEAALKLHPTCDMVELATEFLAKTAHFADARDLQERMRYCIPGEVAEARPMRRAEGFATVAAFYTPYRRDGLATVRAAAERRYSGGPAVTLLHDRVARLEEDGAVSLYVHRLTRVLNRDGILRYGEVALPRGAEVLELRTIKADGTLLEPEFTQHKATVSMPGLAPEDVIEEEYVVRHPRGAFSTAAAFQFTFGSFDAPILYARFVALTPDIAGVELLNSNATPSARVQTANGWTARTWEQNDIAQSPWEPSMLRSGTLPQVRVLPAWGDWNEVEAQVRDALIDAIRVGPRVAQAAPKGSDGAEAVARELYRRVVRAVRPDGGTFLEGWTSAEDTLASGTGSRTATLLALARAAGLQAELALARTIEQQPPAVPALDAYTHPLVVFRVADKEVVVDAETDGIPFGALPPSLAREDALRVPLDRQQRAGIVALPGGGIDESVAEADVTLDPNGDLAATLSIRMNTWRGAQMRDVLRGMETTQRRQFFDQLATRIFPGAIESVGEVRNEQDAEQPLELVVRTRAPHFVNFHGATADVEQIVPALGLRKMYAGAAERRFPLLLDTPLIESAVFRVRLTGGLRLARAVADLRAESSFGTYGLSLRQNGNVLEIRREFRIPAQVVAPAQYPEFARFAQRIDDAERQRLTLDRPVSAATRRSPDISR